MRSQPPITCVTAIASPNARPSPSRTAAEIPGPRTRTARRGSPPSASTPSAIAPSVRSRGTRLKSSRQIAEVIGTIMIVSTSAAGSMPACEGSPEKIGRNPSQLLEPRLEVVARPRARRRGCPRGRGRRSGSRRAARPSSRSAPRSRLGAISVRKSAIAIESGVASRSAINGGDDRPVDERQRAVDVGDRVPDLRPDERERRTPAIAGHACARTLQAIRPRSSVADRGGRDAATPLEEDVTEPDPAALEVRPRAPRDRACRVVMRGWLGLACRGSS